MAGLPISIGSVGVRIVPDMRGFDTKIAAEAQKISDIHIGVDVDTGLAEAKLAALQAEVDAISDVHVGVDVDREGFAAGQLALFDLGEGATVVGGAFGALSTSVDDLVTEMDNVGGGIGGITNSLSAISGGAGAAGESAANAEVEFSLLSAAILGVMALAAPLTAALVPVLTGIGTTVASLGAGLGVLMLAISGVSKAIKAFRTEQLNPTAANLKALNAAMAGLTPAARGFVTFVGSKLFPLFTRLQHAAENGLLPGLARGLKAMEPLFGPLTRFVRTLAGEMGNLAAKAGRALADPAWRKFFNYVTSTAGPTLRVFGKILGNIATGVAQMFQAFAPVTAQLGKALLSLSRGFAEWTKSKSFQSFLAYVVANAPVVGKFFTQLVEAGVRLLVAFAPLGPVLLKVTTAILSLFNKLSPDQILALVTVVGELIGNFLGLGLQVIATATLIIRHWSGIKSFFTGIGHWFSGPFVGFFRRAGHDISVAFNAPTKAIDAAFAGMKRAGSDVGHFFTGPFVHFFTRAWDAVKSGFSKGLHFVESIPGRIRHAIGDAGKILLGVGKKIIGGLWDGIKSGFGGIISGLHSFVGKLEFWKGSPSLAEMAPTLLYSVGGRITQGFGAGIASGWSAVIAILHSAGQSVPKALADGIKAAEGVLSKEITKLKSRLSSLQSARDSLASSLTSGLTQGAALSGFTPLGNIIDPVTGRKVPGTTPGGQTASFLGNFAGELARLVKELARARRLGLDPVLLDQIAGLGPTPQAFAILHDIEGNGHAKAQVATVDRYEARIQGLASKFGAHQAQVEYGPKIDRNTKALDGLTGELRALRRELKAGGKSSAHIHAKAAGRG